MELEFIPIEKDGSYSSTVEAPEFAGEVISATAAMYEKSGYELPWICYLVKENGAIVGTCGFKSPPKDGRAEIAYFTFPEHESRGIATQMASELIRISRETDPTVTVAAQTLPENNASTSILKKLNFAHVDEDVDEEVGPVWEWQLQR